MQNEIITDIGRLRIAVAYCDTISLGQLLQEINSKYGMDNIILTNSRINNTPTTRVQFGVSDYAEHRGLASSYINILESKLVINHVTRLNFSSKAANSIFNNSLPFQQNQSLHSTLKVSDVLAVIGYAKDVYETAGGTVDGRISMGLMALNSIDLALNNKKPDKPTNKLLHLAVDVLAEVAKKLADNKQAGQAISAMSLLTNLTIDFFVKE
jgi:hypothetical protein